MKYVFLHAHIDRRDQTKSKITYGKRHKMRMNEIYMYNVYLLQMLKLKTYKYKVKEC